MKVLSVIGVACLCMSSFVAASEPESCKLVRFASSGSTNVETTTATARLVLAYLGYNTDVKQLTSAETFRNLRSNAVDVFLGNWMPSQTAELDPYLKDNSIESLHANLKGARLTLAVSARTYEAGLKSFADIAKFGEQLHYRITGAQAGSVVNEVLKKMIAENAFDLGKFTVQENDEQMLLASIENSERLKAPEVFIGWEPHPLNTRFAVRYLDGGDNYFGPNGDATVNTLARAGYVKDCDNVGRFLKNLEFTPAAELKQTDTVINLNMNPRQAAKIWLQANPRALDSWLNGVMTRDGKPALAAVKSKLDMP